MSGLEEHKSVRRGGVETGLRHLNYRDASNVRIRVGARGEKRGKQVMLGAGKTVSSCGDRWRKREGEAINLNRDLCRRGGNRRFFGVSVIRGGVGQGGARKWESDANVRWYMRLRYGSEGRKVGEDCGGRAPRKSFH